HRDRSRARVRVVNHDGGKRLLEHGRIRPTSALGDYGDGINVLRARIEVEGHVELTGDVAEVGRNRLTSRVRLVETTKRNRRTRYGLHNNRGRAADVGEARDGRTCLDRG